MRQTDLHNRFRFSPFSVVMGAVLCGLIACDSSPPTENDESSAEDTKSESDSTNAHEPYWPPRGKVGPAGENGKCKIEVHRFGVEDKLPNGIQGAEWVKLIEQEKSLSIMALDIQERIEINPDSSGKSATIKIQANKGEIRHIRSVALPVPKGVKTLPGPCPDYYEVPVSLSLQTEDGAIDGAWETTVVRWDAEDPDPNDLDFLDQGEDGGESETELFFTGIAMPQKIVPGTLSTSCPSFEKDAKKAEQRGDEFALDLQYSEKEWKRADISVSWWSVRSVGSSKKHPNKKAKGGTRERIYRLVDK